MENRRFKLPNRAGCHDVDKSRSRWHPEREAAASEAVRIGSHPLDATSRLADHLHLQAFDCEKHNEHRVKTNNSTECASDLLTLLLTSSSSSAT